MARVKLNSLVNEVHGAVAPDEIHRQKTYRDARGRIIGKAELEEYKVTRPRNWKKTPARAEELINQKSWGRACYLTEELLKTDIGYQYLQHRFDAQLPATRRSRPDKLASIDPNTKTAKRYMRFDAFCRAILRNLLKLTDCATPQQALIALHQHS